MDIHPELEFLRPLTSGWLGKIELARRARAKWQEIADECMMFYSRSAAAMWDPMYTKKFWKGVPAPRFRVTINKAFEMVAVFGPNLFWDIPHRMVEPKRITEIPIEVFGNPEDPSVQQFYQQTMGQAQQESIKDRLICHLMQNWLNYTPREMPGGGLEEHSMLAIIDALIKGRGILWAKPYKFPASDRTLTGCFREPPENLFIDPDFTTIDDSKWIAIRKVAPVWEVERRFQLKPDSLKDRATLESSWAEAEWRVDDEYSSRKVAGQTNDMMEYYEIWSRTGPGARLTGMHTPVKQHLEDTVGDYAWIVVAPTVPYPLNCPSESLRSGMTTDEVRDRFQWPVETWKDGRYPIEVLDFYPDPESAWPIAPLAPAMGELKFLNVIIPHLMNRIWSSSRDFWAILEPAYEQFSKYLREGSDQTILPVPMSLGTKVSDIVQTLQQPQTNMDVWKIIDAVSELFDKRTGLTEFLYGMTVQGTQDRTAETTLARRQQAGVRPGYMAKQVSKWQSRIAALEGFCARVFVEGADIEPLLGQTGAMLWDAVVRNAPVELVARQMNYTISASSIRRPDKDRDIANINQAITVWLPIAAGAAQQTGNYEPVNAMMRKWGDAADMNMEEIQIPEVQQDEQVLAMQQAQLQLEQQKMQLEGQKLQVEVQGKQMDLQGKQMDLQAKQVDAQIKQAQVGLDMQVKQLDAQAKQAQVGLDIQAKQMDVENRRQLAEIDIASRASAAEMAVSQKAQEHQLSVTQDIENFDREDLQDKLTHAREALQAEQIHRQKLQHEKELNEIKIALAKQQAKAKPKPSSGSAKK